MLVMPPRTVCALLLATAACGATPHAHDGRALLDVIIKDDARPCAATVEGRDALVEQSVAHALQTWIGEQGRWQDIGEVHVAYGERGRTGADDTPAPPFVRVWGTGQGVAAYALLGATGVAWCGAAEGGVIRLWPFARAAMP